jgi:hypothetical protein
LGFCGKVVVSWQGDLKGFPQQLLLFYVGVVDGRVKQSDIKVSCYELVDQLSGVSLAEVDAY